MVYGLLLPEMTQVKTHQKEFIPSVTLYLLCVLVTSSRTVLFGQIDPVSYTGITNSDTTKYTVQRCN